MRKVNASNAAWGEDLREQCSSEAEGLLEEVGSRGERIERCIQYHRGSSGR